MGNNLLTPTNNSVNLKNGEMVIKIYDIIKIVTETIHLQQT
jgi:hypothetical protein